jgi:hypothetical protein
VYRASAALTSEETSDALKDGVGLRVYLLKLLDEIHAFDMIGFATSDLRVSSDTLISVALNTQIAVQ